MCYCFMAQEDIVLALMVGLGQLGMPADELHSFWDWPSAVDNLSNTMLLLTK